ncbi:right-handed parallel beta-helix repeat-containing protein [Shewanella gelidimarina]|uniref:right-handed parallel beta-helix repeat-containing protein n=1 Tax=Shewanella gelidimarina TaxID=56813 RepID=UPI00200E0DF8|nr:right-handed parallel beta-helix repeat-containing protein [Shewanella gelidimarina]MCL1056809.1 right-handed parallel beta-helix repeat-containing protein [Shewanella gelidimarina]
MKIKNIALILFTITFIGCGGGGTSAPVDPVDPVAPIAPVDPVAPIDPQTCTHDDTSDGVLVDSVQDLRDALVAASNNGQDDIVYVASGFYDVHETIEYDAQGAVDEKISVLGCGSADVVFDGNGEVQVFHFKKDGDIGDVDDWNNEKETQTAPFASSEVSGITVQNGFCYESQGCNKHGRSGGGILVESYNLTMHDVNFTNNSTMTEGSAVKGAIDLIIKDSHFGDNYVGGIFGGTVSASGLIDIDNTTFTRNNYRSIYRGVSAYVNSCQDPVNISNSKFLDNSGQALAVLFYGCEHGEDSEVNIINSEFTNNTTQYSVLNVHGGDVNLINSKFDNNQEKLKPGYKCTNGGSTWCATGGILSWGKYERNVGVVTIDGSEFTRNKAADYGGVISMGNGIDCETTLNPSYAGCDTVKMFNSDIEPEEYDLVVKNSTFDGNISHHGAVLAVGKFDTASSFQFGNVYIENSVFKNNIGERYAPEGQYIYGEEDTSIILTAGDFTYFNMTLENNTAETELLVKGNINEL